MSTINFTPTIYSKSPSLSQTCYCPVIQDSLLITRIPIEGMGFSGKAEGIEGSKFQRLTLNKVLAEGVRESPN